MKPSDAVSQLTYNPNRLLDELIRRLNLKTDRELAAALETHPAKISKLRNRKFAVSAMQLIRMHELTGISIRELRLLLGDRRRNFR